MGSSFPNCMDEWNPVDINTQTKGEEIGENVAMDGLMVDASALQADFDNRSTHLDEVRARHSEVLVTAGMLPETGLADQHPERALAWLVESVNGRVNPDGLSIPLLGADLDDIQLDIKSTDETRLIRLQVQDGDMPTLVREFPLPAEASEAIEASFVQGRLHLRW